MSNDLTVRDDDRIESLIARAIDKGTPVETMERLLVMRTQLKAEAAREAYFHALAALQSELPIVAKTQAVDYGQGKARYRYAPFDEIIKVVQPYLYRHGFSVTIDERRDTTGAYAVATAHHVEGHSESSEFPIVVDPSARMNAAQQQASARTYAKRYAYCNVLGIVTGDEDDDAHASSPPPWDKVHQNRPPTQAPLRTVPTSPPTGKPVSDAQRKRLWAIAKAGGHSNDAVKTWLAGVYNLTSSLDITSEHYDTICNRLTERAPLNEPEPPPVDYVDDAAERME